MSYLQTATISNNNAAVWAQLFSAYRIFFSCAHVGKVIPSTKRVVTWEFGFSDAQAIKHGLTGEDCKGENHEVILTWSIRSGRVQVMYNSKDITSLGTFSQHTPSRSNSGGVESSFFRLYAPGSDQKSNGSASSAGNSSPGVSRGRSFFPKVPMLSRNSSSESTSQESSNSKNSKRSMRSSSPSAPSFIEFSWRTSTDHKITIHAHVTEPPGYNQYELLIDGKSFESLPTAYELGTNEYAMKHRSNTPSPEKAPARRQRSKFSNGRDHNFNLHRYPEEAEDATEDSMEVVRNAVEGAVPGTEMMLSRAIINAFTDDKELKRILPTESTKERAKEDSLVYEADCIFATFQWLRQNSTNTTHTHDSMDRKYLMLQTQINRMVAVVRHSLLSPYDASKAIHSVAAILGMELAVPVTRNTIVLFGLRRDVKRSHVLQAMKIYGTVDNVAVASGDKGFALCRFRGTNSAKRAIGASMRDEIVIQHVSPQVTEVTQLFNTSLSFSNGPDIPMKPQRSQSDALYTNKTHHQQHRPQKTYRTFDPSHNFRQEREERHYPQLSQPHRTNSVPDSDMKFITHKLSQTDFDDDGQHNYIPNRNNQSTYSKSYDDDGHQYSTRNRMNHTTNPNVYNDNVQRYSMEDRKNYAVKSYSRERPHSFNEFNTHHNQISVVRKPSLDDGGRFNVPETEFPYDLGSAPDDEVAFNRARYYRRASEEQSQMFGTYDSSSISDSFGEF
mmetsp:Transcript_7131/g.9259  ORF Transcript_7131/g.9259 Transcript_7131/m.9259 type:complete len:728 (-) Transcript_7131:122-2305(-)|eukprot:CAMPEP_0116051162 /NCGR_PEP_ID=MMETSP0322-20121206/814_1 /TAXON_ID=163516 /ORGANISM="Leptocylindrus danicus var. apora, Strain B651" /LENGTH=727 /DNA_ID=CAMNT_0003533855 /DNA_START=153 /DNA_END=2336 /DNA_ORIENTATION=-